jgi:light-regulated signal transduction histidine kinase (bacteriophytochrome)
MNLKPTDIAKIKELEAKALESCNQEPLAFIDSIQDFGYLLVFDTQALTITHASENTFLLFNTSKDTFIGASLLDFLDRETYHSIANVSSRASTKKQRSRVCQLQINNKALELSLFRTQKSTVLEFFKLNKESSQNSPDDTLNWILDLFNTTQTSSELINLSTKLLKDISGFDRVMLYKFHLDDSGEVIAESKKEAIEGYMGMRFPAFDIPPVARDLFKRIPLRYIHHTGTEGIPIYYSASITGTLDLSLSLLRAVSPVHMQYLKNMGVTSSLSMPILIQGRLWGLMACHNLNEFNLSPELKYKLKLFNSLFSKYLEDLLDIESEVLLKPIKQIAQNLLQIDQLRDYNKNRWSSYAEVLSNTLSCNGLALLINQDVYCSGICPSSALLKAYVNEHLEETTLHHTQNTQEFDNPEWQGIKSILGINASSNKFKVVLLFFRTPEKVVEPWAGNPKKDLVYENEKIRLHPRGSFKEFTIASTDKAKLWSAEEIKIAHKLRDLLYESGLSVQLKEKEHLDLIVRELNHKIRNIASLVLSVTHQTELTNNNAEDYKRQVEDRISAIIAAVNLISSNNHTISIRELLKNTVLPLASKSDKILVSGKTIELPPNYATLLALVFQELATNALKYGALSVEEGRVHISLISEDHEFEIIWKEENGPEVSVPNKSGFGSKLLDQAIQFELGGTSHRAFNPEGFMMRFTIPKDIAYAKKEDSINLTDTAKQSEVTPTILVVEDHFLIAEELKTLIQEFNLGQCNTVATVSEALFQIKKHSYELAILDVHLKDGDCLQLAKACQAKKLPFFYLTGNEKVLLDNKNFPSAPILVKPVNKMILKKRLVAFFS